MGLTSAVGGPHNAPRPRQAPSSGWKAGHRESFLPQPVSWAASGQPLSLGLVLTSGCGEGCLGSRTPTRAWGDLLAAPGNLFCVFGCPTCKQSGDSRGLQQVAEGTGGPQDA